MGKRERWQREVQRAWGNDAALERCLLEGSGLPGPRSNLELADVVAIELAGHGVDAGAWSLARRWSRLGAVQAPSNNPAEFLAFCGVQALAAMYDSVDDTRRAEVRECLTAAAQDERWRMREAAAMALQRMGLRSFGAVESMVEAWLADGAPMLLRAAIAALADPPLLHAAGYPQLAISAADSACRAYAGAAADMRKQEPWRVLRKGLEYAPSVIVAASPADGFKMLSRWAESRDVDIKKIVVANLRKTRLARAYPEEVEAVGQVLAWSWDGELTDP